MLLMYYRTYTTYDLLGMIFNLDKSNVCRRIQYLEPAIKHPVPIPSKKYADSKKVTNMQQLLKFFPELTAITDGTEQPIPRPKNRTKRKTHYSGKKKKYTVQNQITTNLNGEIIHKSPHAPGSRPWLQDIQVKASNIAPSTIPVFWSWVFGCWERLWKSDQCFAIQEKKGQKITAWQKAYNKTQSEIRIKVEHAIAQIKKFRISSEVFRNKLSRYDTISEMA